MFFGWLLGALYDYNVVYLVVVSVVAQLASIIFYIICVRVEDKAGKQINN